MSRLSDEDIAAAMRFVNSTHSEGGIPQADLDMAKTLDGLG